jgi:two-component system, sensor histidine kinase and response regulator
MAAADPSWRQLRVLVVDDVEAMRLINTALLGQLGIKQVRDAADGRAALHLLERETFDLVLSDWRMPGMDGMELLQALRSSELLRTLPFVLVSAETDPEALAPALAAGAQGLLVKPYGAPALADAIRAALGQSSRTYSASVSAVPLTVLLLNSEPLSLHENAELLKPVCRVKIATHGDRALVLCQADEPPDLLLVDADAAGLDALDLCRRLRLHPSCEAIAVVLMTSNTEASWRHEALEQGVLDCLIKPVTPQDLLQRVRNFGRFLTKQHQHRQQAELQARQAQSEQEVGDLVDADLRTPLAAALALLEPLLSDDQLNEDQRTNARAVEMQLLETLDTLHLSSEVLRIEQGRFSLKTRGVPLRKLAERAARLVADSYAHKQLTFKVQVPGPLRGAGAVLASGDPLLCHTVLHALMRLACEAAPEGSTINIHTAAAGAEAYVLHIGFKAVVAAHLRPRYFAKSSGKQLAYAARSLAQAQRGDVKLRVDESAQHSELCLQLLRSQLTMAGG